MKSISYTLAHNIIYAGVEFAEDYGFKPHKIYTSVAQYILEEDTEDIKLIHIECGVDGKPVFYRDPFDNDVSSKNIVAQLEREAGPGNYSVVDIGEMDEDEWEEDVEWDEDEIEEQEKKFSGLSIKEKLDLIKKLFARINELNDEEKKDLGFLSNTVLDEYVDFDKANNIYDDHNHFSYFLKLYIDSIYSKRSTFAKDIDIAPVSLSQVINNHREPKEEFIMKLMIHSEKVFENVCEFHKKIWYQVYFHEKICDTMSNQEQWRPKIEKHVRISEAI